MRRPSPTFAVVKRELGSCFGSPVAYVFLVAFLVLAGALTFTAGGFFERGAASLAAFFAWHPWLYLFLVPAVGMRLWAEERRSGTLELLLTMPIAVWQASAGKFLANWVFLLAALALTFPMWVTINVLGTPDNGAALAGYLGSALLSGSFLAIACAASATTRNQAVSYVASACTCLALILIGLPPVTDLLAGWFGTGFAETVAYFGVLGHFDTFVRGVIELRDVVYFLSLIGLGLVIADVAIGRASGGNDGLAPRRRLLQWGYTSGGIAAAFAIAVATNVVADSLDARLDLTEGRVYTLAPATRAVLATIEAPVTVRYYASLRGNALPVGQRTYAKRVRDLLGEYRRVAPGKVTVEALDPEPDSHAEESAQLDGIQGQDSGDHERFYLGMTVASADRRVALPVLSPLRERLLEYDITRAILRAATRDKPIVGVMSALPVLGRPLDPVRREPASEPWAVATDLRNAFDVRGVDLAAGHIPDDIAVLVVIHPRDISARTEYAIDQFVLRGGRLVAFLDAYAYIDRRRDTASPFAPLRAAQSTLPHLLRGWGLQMAMDQVVADLTYATGTGARLVPALLTIPARTATEGDGDEGHAGNLLMPFATLFVGQPTPGLTRTDLVRSSANAAPVDLVLATSTGELATRGFAPTGTRYTIATRVEGRFAPAFRESAVAANTASGDDQSTGASRESVVTLVADVDLLSDDAAVAVHDEYGQRVLVPVNGNLGFAVGLVESAAGTTDFAPLRNRASTARPLTVLRNLEMRAQSDYLGKIRELEDTLRELQDRVTRMREATGTATSIAEEAQVDALHRKAATTRRTLMDARRGLRADAEALQTRVKLANFALVPALVLLACVVVFTRARRARA